MQARARPKPPSVPASPPALRALPFALLFGALLAGVPALAGPEGGRVVSGKADIVQTSPTRLDIVQGSDKAVIDWRSFSIGAGEHTDFRQPSSSSIALNRVRGGAYSRILGRLTANGRIFLINPNGILFGATARVDVGGLLATTIDIGDDDFLAGRFDFDIPGSPGGTVVNRGEITAAEGGLAALVAPGVENSGTIRARLGRVALASGNAFTLDLHGDNLIRIGIDDRVAERLIAADGAELEALVSNSGAIEADGGTVVLLAAGAGRDVVDYAINMDGIVRARTAEQRNGRIVLRGAGDGVVRVAGTLDASGRGSGETGGAVRVLGEKVGIVGEARIDASGDAGGGEILVGGNFQGKGPERNADYTAVGSGAFIRADALSRGDGGRAIVWSNRVTRFFGGISARGGSASGDGGFAEVSGKLHLQFAPVSIDLGAPNGALGELLLDPQDIVIATSSTNDDSEVSDNAILFGDEGSTPPTDYTIQPSAFQAVDADITLQATRDITVSSAIAMTGQTQTRTLTLQAGRHLAINADITGHSTHGHNFIFEADSPRSTGGAADGTGTLTIAGGVTIDSNNGDITLIGADFSIDTTSGSEASLDAGTGDIHIAPSRSTASLKVGSATTDILSNAELGRLTTSGTIVIGTATTGPTSSGGAGSPISAASITVGEALSIGGSASLKFDSGGATTLGANVSTADGSIAFKDPVALSASVTVNSDSDNDDADGNIVFRLPIEGGHALTIEAGTGSVTLVAGVGDINRLASLTATGGLIDLNRVAVAGALSVTGTTIDLNGGSYSSQGGAISFTGAVNLQSVHVTVDSGTGAGDIAFSSTVNGGHALTVTAGTGSVTFSGAVGGSTALTRLSVTGSGGIGIGANVTASGGDIAFNSAVTLSGAATVALEAGATGAIRFASAITGAFDLTLDAGDRAVTLAGAVTLTGTGRALTVTGGRIDLASVSTSGAISVTGTNIDLNAGSYSSQGGAISFTGAVNLQSVHVTVDSGTGAGDIAFSSTVSGGRALTVEAGTGRVTLGGDVTLSGANALTVDGGGGIALGAGVTTVSTAGGAIAFGDALTLEGSDALSVTTGTGGGGIVFSGTVSGGRALTVEAGTGSVTFGGAVKLVVVGDGLSVTAGGATMLNADVTTQGGAITFTGNVTLYGSGATRTVTSNNGAVAFSGSVDGAKTLSVAAGTGSVTFSGAVGGATALTSLTVTGSGTVTLSGSVTVSASTGTAVSFAGPVFLAADARVTGGGGAISFGGAVSGAQALTVAAGSGSVTFSGAVGSGTALTSLTVTGSGTVTLSGSVTVSASTGTAVSFAGPVFLAADARVTGGGGAISFGGAVSGAQALTVVAATGSVTFSAAVGGTTALSSLSVTGSGGISVGAGVTTANGNIAFNSAVMLTGAGALTISSGSGAGNITFSSTVNGGRALTVTAGSGSVTFSDAVGASNLLTGLTATGSAVSLKSVSTSGAISVTGSTTLHANVSASGQIDFNSAVTLAGDVNVVAGGNPVTFHDTVDGGHGLNVGHAADSVTFIGALGDTTALSNLVVNGATTLHASVTTSSSVVFWRAVTLSGSGALSVSSSGGGIIQFGDALDGGRALTLNAGAKGVFLQGVVGGSTPLSSLDVTGSGTVTLSGSVTVSASTGTAVSFAGPVSLAADATVTGGGGAISFGGAVSGSHALTVEAGAGTVMLSGNVTLSGANALTVNGGSGITLGSGVTSVTTAGGAVGFGDAVTLSGSGALTVSSGSGGGNITFSGTVDGGRALTVNAGSGTVRFGGAVGMLSSLSVTSTNTGTGAITLGAGVTTSGGAITFTGNVTLDGSGATRAVTSNNGAVAFSGSVDGAKTLSVAAGTGSVTFSGAVGGATALTSLTVTGSGTVTLSGSVTVSASTGTAVSFAGPVFLAADARVTGGGGAISFGGAVSGAQALTVVAATGSVTFSAAVGGTTALSSLSVTGSGGISVGAGVTTANGNIAFNSAVMLTGAGALTISSGSGAGNITFSSTVNGGRALTVTAGSGSVTFSDAVGGSTRLTSLTVTGGQIDLAAVSTTGMISVTGTNIDLDAGSYNSQGGDIAFTGPVDLDHSSGVTVSSGTGGGNIAFSGTVNGGHSLTVTSGSGNVTFGGAVGSAGARLTSLEVDGGRIDLANVFTSGQIDIDGTAIDLNGADYRSTTGAIDFRDPVTLTTGVSVSSTSGKITFHGTVGGSGRSLTVNAGTGDAELKGAVGATGSRLSRLTVAGGQIDLASVFTGGAIDIDGTNIDLNAGSYNSQGGNITFTGPVDLHADATVDSGGNIAFSEAVNGAHNLTVRAGSGTVTFGGAVMLTGAGSLSVTTSGATMLNADVTTSGGTIGFNGGGAVTLGGSGATRTVTSNNGNIAFSGPVNGARALTVDAGSGSVTFSAAVGGTTALTGFSVTGNAVSLKSVRVTGTGAVSVTGSGGIALSGTYSSQNRNIDFNNPVTLVGAVTVNSGTGGGNVSFDATVNGGHSLTIEAGTGSLTFSGAVGGATALTSLTVDGGHIDLNAVATTGAISVTGTNIDLNAGSYSSQGGDISFTGPVDLDHSSGVTVGSGGGDISFDNVVNGGRTLTVTAGTGSVTFSGAAGGSAKLASLTVSGGQIDLNSVATTGAISVAGANIDLNAATYETDSGDITFTGPVDLHADVTVDSDANGDGTGGTIHFTSTVDSDVHGLRALTLDAGENGTITVDGAIGAARALRRLVTIGAAVNLRGGFSVTGDIRVQGAITLGNESGITTFSSGDIHFTGAVMLAGDVIMRLVAGATGAIRFDSTITGTFDLTLDAGDRAVTLNGAAGTADSRLASLTVTGGRVSLQSVATTGTVSITGTNIDLNGATYSSQDGDITFTGAVNLNTDVRLDGDADEDGAAGSIAFTGAVEGAGHALTVVRAYDVTVHTSMNVASFTQLAGTGTTDFGSDTLRAETFVDVSARNIYGKIIAKGATLKAANFIGTTVEVGSLTIEAKNADIDGTVGGIGGQGAADKTIINNRGPGSYRLNGYTILGTGPGTRTHAELSALPLSGTLVSARRPATAADAAFSPFIPVFRASTIDAIDKPYAIDIFETPFPLLAPLPGTDPYDGEPPGVIQKR